MEDLQGEHLIERSDAAVRHRVLHLLSETADRAAGAHLDEAEVDAAEAAVTGTDTTTGGVTDRGATRLAAAGAHRPGDGGVRAIVSVRRRGGGITVHEQVEAEDGVRAIRVMASGVAVAVGAGDEGRVQCTIRISVGRPARMRHGGSQKDRVMGSLSNHLELHVLDAAAAAAGYLTAERRRRAMLLLRRPCPTSAARILQCTAVGQQSQSVEHPNNQKVDHLVLENQAI